MYRVEGAAEDADGSGCHVNRARKEKGERREA
jgi:hypothetical protein